MTKYWKTIVQNGLSDLTLYTFTTDEGIRTDLDSGESKSLILRTIWEKRRVSRTHDTDHADLAAGAFSAHRDEKGYKQSNLEIVEVSAIPDGLDRFPIIMWNPGDNEMKANICVFEEPKDGE